MRRCASDCARPGPLRAADFDWASAARVTRQVLEQASPARRWQIASIASAVRCQLKSSARWRAAWPNARRRVGVVQQQAHALAQRDAVGHQVARLAVDDRFLQAALAPGDDGHAEAIASSGAMPNSSPYGAKTATVAPRYASARSVDVRWPRKTTPLGASERSRAQLVGWTAADDVQRQVGHVAPHVEQAVEAFFGRQAADRDGVRRASAVPSTAG